MIESLPLDQIIFLDIETVPMCPSYKDLPDVFKPLWDKKASFFCKEEQTPEDVYERAGIYAEFGKIVCISCGMATNKLGETHFKVKSYYNDDEKQLLTEFVEMLNGFAERKPYFKLCAHNGQEFDFPYIARRCLINGIKLPKILDLAGKKPWEVKDRLIDTLQLWKFGDYKHFTSLPLLCAAFNIPTPKDDIDGSQVAGVYYEEGDLERIARYCEKDVITLLQLLLRWSRKDLLPTEAIESVCFGE